MTRLKVVLALALVACCSALTVRQNVGEPNGECGSLIVRAARPAPPLEGGRSPTSAGPADENENVFESFTVERNGDLVLIPVTIAGKEFQFILDTGSSINVFDTSLKDTLSPMGDTVIYNRKPGIELYESRDATVGRSRRPLGKRAVCQDLSRIRKISQHNVRGILGMDFLRSLVVCLDFDGGRVSFVKSSAGLAGQRLPINFDGLRRPTVKAYLGGVGKVPFLVDTGSFGFDNGFLCSEVFDELIQSKLISHVRLASTLNLDGVVDSRIGTVPLVAIDSELHFDQVFHEHRGEGNGFGLGYLSRYRVTLDFPNSLMLLDRSKQFDRIFEDQSGIDLVRSDDALTVQRAGRDRLGYQSGIRVGDSILDVDGVSTRDITLYAARRLLREGAEGRRLTIAESPGGATRKVYLSVGQRPDATSRNGMDR